VILGRNEKRTLPRCRQRGWRINRPFSLLFIGLLVAAPASAQRTFDVDILSETFAYDEDTTRAIDLDKLNQGCPARDCIPSIDAPKFVAAAEADHVNDDDIVIVIAYGGEHRAYPARILDQHEIVNDTIAGDPIAITWCPLCGSAVGVRREFGGKVTEFGVSVLLYNSDLVFYDRATNTLWDQIEARGIVGPLTGEQLEFVPVSMTRWSRWRAAHPDTLVLSPDTGFDYDYSIDRYGEYRDSTRIVFPVNEKDDRIHPKAVVYGFMLDDGPIALSAKLFEQSNSLRHEHNGRVLDVRMSDDGLVTLDTGGASVSPIRLYWFAWYTFHPDTVLVR
jgi:hypothetical protein